MMWTSSVDIHQKNSTVLMMTRSEIGLMLIHGLHTHLLNRYTSCPYSLTTSSYRQRSLVIILLTYLTITYPKPPMSRGVRPIRSWKSSTHGTPPPTYIVKPLIGCPIVDGSMGNNGYMCKRTEVRIHGSPLMPSPDSLLASGIPVSALCSHEDATAVVSWVINSFTHMYVMRFGHSVQASLCNPYGIVFSTAGDMSAILLLHSHP
ncbi:hypothetical protein NEOLEDRAFT_1139162 [Neolentinus lepideus HHB14362 ss-1]|uniref:Uncharacterized protein n=1 Tax=Neolentinus lepideus HHB14362 ss-1 TaxID=1314782 RepID=A0A165PVM2_9AGAM|nr:hypothetical protein NEOLEDRAFT_1139162 [Neolentinus lepideus HHB14362 ss-1]